MAYIRIDSAVASTAIFRTILRLLRHAPACSTRASEGTSAAPVRDARALEAFSRMSDEQLGDIGVYRAVRDIQWDTLARPPHAEKTVIFDYFRLDG